MSKEHVIDYEVYTIHPDEPDMDEFMLQTHWFHCLPIAVRYAYINEWNKANTANRGGLTRYIKKIMQDDKFLEDLGKTYIQDLNNTRTMMLAKYFDKLNKYERDGIAKERNIFRLLNILDTRLIK